MFNRAEQRLSGAMTDTCECTGGKQQGKKKSYSHWRTGLTKQIGINQPQLHWKLQEDFWPEQWNIC